MTDPVRELLTGARTIAVVGLSEDTSRPAYGVAQFLQQHGYRIVPVHPTAQSVLGEKAYPTLTAAAGDHAIDIVDVFRRADAVPSLVDEVLALKLPALWLQETVVHEEAARRARAAGVFVVMDKCILKEHRRLRI
ncbi:MAG: CoA-binding protein [Acidobacteriota bacterium]|nr:CoA-binding protein [Acidobacteriota bacterium]